MKTHTAKNIGKRIMKRTLLYAAAASVLFLMTACGGTTMKTDMTMANARPSTDKQNTISAYELHKILTDHFGFVTIKLSDAQYALADNDKLAQLMSSDYCKPNGGKEKAGWGSDDYAIAEMVQMRNYAFGTMYASAVDGNKKVMNVLVNNSKKVVSWDPQTCQSYAGIVDKPEFILL